MIRSRRRAGSSSAGIASGRRRPGGGRGGDFRLLLPCKFPAIDNPMRYNLALRGGGKRYAGRCVNGDAGRNCGASLPAREEVIQCRVVTVFGGSWRNESRRALAVREPLLQQPIDH